MRTPKYDSRNRHHLLYPKADWNKGYAKYLRAHFSRKILARTHNGLHAEIMCIPVPPAPMFVKAWERYKKEEARVNSLDVIDTIDWLIRNIPDQRFRDAMRKQRSYLLSHKYY